MCQNQNRVYLGGIDAAAGTAYWTRPDCKLWSCEECAEVNSRRWQAIVAEGIKEYQLLGITDCGFVIMTCRGYHSTFQQTLDVWRKNWPKFHARMKRKYPNMKYVYLPELHKDGRMHQHALASGGMSTRWLKDNAYGCGFGYIARSEELVSVTHAVFYVTKYITKSLVYGTKWPVHLHRVRTSLHWPKVPQETPEMPVSVEFKPIPADHWQEVHDEWIRLGLIVTDIKTGEIEGIGRF